MNVKKDINHTAMDSLKVWWISLLIAEESN